MMPFASPYGSPLYWSFRERPEAWHIDTFHQYAKQLVFFGGGRFTHSTHYHDSSLYGNHGKLTNMDPATDWVRKLGRWATDHDGINDFINCGNTASLKTAIISQIGMSAWIYPTSVANQIIFAKWGSGINTENSYGFRLLSSGGSNYLRCFLGTSGGVTVSADFTDLPIAVNTWNYVCAIKDSFGIKGFVNGVQSAISTSSTSDLSTVSSESMLIGRLSLTHPVTYYFGGLIADPMIWSRALSSEEIKPLADPGNVMLSLGGSDSGLIVPDDLVYPVYLPSSIPAGAKPALWLGVCV